MPPLRIGLLGTGRVGQIHAEALAALPEASLVAVADPDLVARDAFADRHGVVARFRELDEMLAAVDLDAVYICTPPGHHAEQACAALAAGRHVFVEKPLATRLQDLEPILEAARRGQRWAQVGHVTRFDRELIHLRRMVQDGRLGRVFRVRVLSVSSFLPTGWHGDRSIAGGGILSDSGTHALDALRFVLGDPPCSDVVEARMGAAFAGHDVEDYLIGLLDLGGSLVTLECSYGTPREAGGSSATIELFGTAGYARNRPFAAALRDGDAVRETREVPEDVGGALPTDGAALFQAQARHFVDCCQAGRTGIDGLEIGAEVVRIVDALYRSAETRARAS